MLRLINNRIKSIVHSNKGMAVYLVMFFFLPVMLIVLGVTIDLTVYLNVRAQLQNSLDFAATRALNNSTLDSYRVDKVLKVIFDQSSNHDFVNKLKEGIDVNLRTNAVISQDRTTLSFKPGIPLTPYTAQVRVIKAPTGGGKEYNDINDAYNTSSYITNGSGSNLYATDCDIQLVLATYIDLPVYKKITDFFSFRFNRDMFRVPITVTNNIRGIRIKAPKDFTDYGFEKP